jgi:hypothetical protein
VPSRRRTRITTRDIQDLVKEPYGVEVPPTPVSQIIADLKDGRAVAADPKTVYTAAAVLEAEWASSKFAEV